MLGESAYILLADGWATKTYHRLLHKWHLLIAKCTTLHRPLDA